MREFWRRGIGAAVIATMVATTVAGSSAAAAEPQPGWTATIGTDGEVRYFDIAAGDNGSVVLAGWDQRDTGGGLPETDGVVRKLDASGNEIWKTLVGDDGAADYIDAVDIGVDGSIFVTGRTRGDIGGRTGGTDFDAFVAKLSATGAVQWTAQFGLNGTNKDDVGVAIAADDDGSVFVGAQVSFSTSPAVLRFDANGNEVWRFAYGQAGDFISDMAFGGDGSAYFVGTGTGDGFIISASAAGTMSSTTRVPGLTSPAVAAAPDGDIVVAGEGYLARFGSFGIAQWTNSTVPFDIVDVSVESDDSIVAFTRSTSGTSPVVRGFTATGTLEGWSKPLAAAERGAIAATDDGGVATSSIDSSFQVTHLARFTGSVTGGGGGGGGGGTAGFTDVSPGAFYAEAVAWLKDQGITTGTSATTYSPDDVVTRGQMAAFLHRLAGSPGANPAHGFTDVDDTAFYAEPVRWLKDQGITTGTSATTYSPDDVVTRGQMAAFLHRMATDSDWDYPGD
jgi:S-layer homology domain